ncbi:Dehydrogenase FUM7 [Hyphodiscus hymeniophilus]|uniref:Dehydrogenase FUM7 n=1 Tax=Hyphodiscus hymeniophilus TaxID=353542 RepID=A0A9P7AZN8_9HELO|nr:Dehydrogenase FUM7 [Hyphodiscus hymeniophilus]
MIYGPGAVQKHLKSCLPSEKSKAFIITGSSLARTHLIKDVESILSTANHAGTFSKVGQHAPIAQLDEATNAVKADPAIDTIISIGGGSPIDSAKAISYRVHEKTGNFLHHISIPTTLSAAECSFLAGYTSEDGMKIGVRDPKIAVSVIIYDSKFGLETPERLWISTGLRALDHAVELMYNPAATEAPSKALCLTSIQSLFENLQKYKANPRDEDVITKCFLAAFTSLYPMGVNIVGGIGLSHSLGYALGSPYGIPHGITSCLTLGKVVKLKAQDPEAAEQIARILPFIGKTSSGDNKKDAIAVGDAIVDLVQKLGLSTNLTELKVGEDQVPKIVKLATGGKEPNDPLYKHVEALVKTLY